MTLADGVARYDFDISAELQEDDVIEAYVGDYLIGSEIVVSDPARDGAFSVRIPLHGLPLMEFPTELRTVLARTAREIASLVPIRDPEGLLVAAGPPRARAELTAVGDRSVSFELSVETLPEYSRELILYINGADAGRAKSRPLPFEGHPSCVTHEVTFPLKALLRDGAYVEITDLATSAGIHASSITWMNIMGPVLASLKRLQARYDVLSSYFERAQSRMDALANISRDHQLLDRLDMFYFLINDRLDREVKWLANRIDPAAAEAALADRVAPAAQAIDHRSAHEIDGIGFYEVETDGNGFWRWFGPDVTLFLKDVSTSARTLLLQFGAVGTGVNFTEVTGSVNGLAMLPEFGTSSEGYLEVTIAIGPGGVRSDRAIILNLSFKQAYRPPGDARALCAAFVAAQIFSS